MGAQHLEQDEMVIKNEIQRAKDRGKGGIQDLYSCGYKDGFHSMFKADGEAVKWLFICPNCHEIFDIGYTVPPFPKIPNL